MFYWSEPKIFFNFTSIKCFCYCSIMFTYLLYVLLQYYCTYLQYYCKCINSWLHNWNVYYLICASIRNKKKSSDIFKNLLSFSPNFILFICITFSFGNKRIFYRIISLCKPILMDILVYVQAHYVYIKKCVYSLYA